MPSSGRTKNDATRQAITEKGLRVLSLTEVENVVWDEDQSLHFSATLILQPAFDLPDYKGIPVMCTYHPAFLLPHRQPEKKKDVWDDMKTLLAKMGKPIPKPQGRPS